MMRMDFSKGIPAECRTLVAVPAMLTSERTVRDLVEQLELRYLANRDDNLRFALLSDFPDAQQETTPGDQRLLALAGREIERLNERVLRRSPAIFFLLHRPRKWNPQQGTWMAQEAKTGQAGRPEPPAANGQVRGVQHNRRRLDTTPRGPLRDHARQRHAPAPRLRPRAGRLRGPSLEPAGTRPADPRWSLPATPCFSRG